MNRLRNVLIVAILVTSALAASAAPVAARSCSGYIHSQLDAAGGSKRALARNYGKLARAAAGKTDIYSPECRALAEALGVSLP